MDRHRLKQLRDKVGELHRFGSPSCMREASSIMRDEFDAVLSFALDASKPEPKPKRTIADRYPAGGLTAAEPCMYCEDYRKIEEQNEKLVGALKNANVWLGGKMEEPKCPTIWLKKYTRRHNECVEIIEQALKEKP